MELKTKLCSSLAKVLPGREPEGCSTRNCMALAGENYSFQLAYFTPDLQSSPIQVSVESELKSCITVREVKLIPAEYISPSFDEDYITKEPGLLPDLLRPLQNDSVRAINQQWRSLWIKVAVPKDCKAGRYPIQITLTVKFPPEDTKSKLSNSQTLTLEVLPAQLPPQTLKCTNWFHTDCLATYYNVPVFSEKYWEITGNFMKSAANHGINMLLTPLFTPPLDTEVGGERPTVQLVDVKVTKGKYTFDFQKLDRWIALAKESGIQYFEMSHLFTQWGACFTPKIMATVNGKEKRIFGWDVASDSKEYTEFLDAFLPEIAAYLKKNRLKDNVYFHCSDEPSPDHLQVYAKAIETMRKHLEGFKIMDALSNTEYYLNGLVAYPVPSETHLEEFIKAGIKEIWTYYCCGPVTTYCNRFMGMTSSRNRILGALMYYYGIEGFLHWGFNFYYAQFSKYPIDPYKCTDAGCAYPAGDSFVVYPGENGIPEDSIRLEVFHEALQDMRAMQLLESQIPRGGVLKLLDKSSPNKKMSMADYPRGEEAVLELRKNINLRLKKLFSA